MGIRNLIMNKFRLKNHLDERIVAKQLEKDEKIRKAHEVGRYSFFENDFANEFLDKCVQVNDYDRYITFYNMIESWDDVCNLSLESGEYVSNLWLSDLDKIPAIHRTNLGPYEHEFGIPQNNLLEEIMDRGLINNGHGMQGAFVGTPSLALTTMPLDSFTGMINLFGSYKSNNTTIILQFPRELVRKDLEFTSKDASKIIYDNSNGLNIIKPEYILGAIVKSDDGLDQYYSKEQILSVGKSKAM